MPRKRIWQILFYISTWAAFAENACVEGGHIFPNALFGKSPPYEVSRDAQWGRTASAQVQPRRRHRARALCRQRPRARSALRHGPFIFRTLDLVTPEEAREWRVVPRGQMNAIFALDPPDVLVAGGYRYRDTAEAHGLDVHIEHWARRQGWQAIVSPSGTLTIYLRPGAPRLTGKP